MLLLRVIDDRGAVTEYLAVFFPYRIGRAATADLRLEAPGVWDHHATIALGDAGKFIITSEAASLLLVNGTVVTSAELAAGDELTLGAARVVVSLAPVRQTRLKLTEALVWCLLIGVALVQFVVILLAQ